MRLQTILTNINAVIDSFVNRVENHQALADVTIHREKLFDLQNQRASLSARYVSNKVNAIVDGASDLNGVYQAFYREESREALLGVGCVLCSPV